MHVVITIMGWRENAMVDWKEEIAATLKNEAAKLPPNSRFYPIRKMMTRFNTSQRTIEQVMEKLVTENVMVRRPGNGYFTRNQSPNRLLHYRLIYPKWPCEMLKFFESIWFNYSKKTGKFCGRGSRCSGPPHQSWPSAACNPHHGTAR